MLLHPHPPRPLLPPAGEGGPSSGGFCKKSGTEPARLANRIDRKIKPLDTKPETVPAPWGKEIGDRPRAVGKAEDFAGDLLDLAIDEFLIEGPTVFLVTG